MAGNYDLPQVAREIAEVIGRERALYLVGQVIRWDAGGHYGKSQCLYVPKKLKPKHRLVEILGWDDAAALVKEFGGIILQISSSKGVITRFRDQEIRRMAAAGLANHEIADIFGIGPSYAGKIKGA